MLQLRKWRDFSLVLWSEVTNCETTFYIRETEKWLKLLSLIVTSNFGRDTKIVIVQSKKCCKSYTWYGITLGKRILTLTTILDIQTSVGTKFQLKLTIFIFGTKFTKSRYFRSKAKSEHHHWILHIWIRLGTEFQHKLTILIFWTTFAQKGYFQSKTEKVNTITDFCKTKLVYVPHFSWNWQFLFCRTKSAQRGYFQSKKEKVNISTEFCIFIFLWCCNGKQLLIY